jgi:hypothetical protein
VNPWVSDDLALPGIRPALLARDEVTPYRLLSESRERTGSKMYAERHQFPPAVGSYGPRLAEIFAVHRILWTWNRWKPRTGNSDVCSRHVDE